MLGHTHSLSAVRYAGPYTEFGAVFVLVVYRPSGMPAYPCRRARSLSAIRFAGQSRAHILSAVRYAGLRIRSLSAVKSAGVPVVRRPSGMLAYPLSAVRHAGVSIVFRPSGSSLSYLEGRWSGFCGGVSF